MDNETLSIEVFLRSLTEDQMNTCERDEEQLRELFKAGWSEANAVRFHRAMFQARRVMPDATVEGVFELAFRFGFVCMGDKGFLAQMRADGNAGLTTQKRGKKNSVRGAGVRVVGVPGNKHGRTGVSIREA